MVFARPRTEPPPPVNPIAPMLIPAVICLVVRPPLDPRTFLLSRFPPVFRPPPGRDEVRMPTPARICWMRAAALLALVTASWRPAFRALMSTVGPEMVWSREETTFDICASIHVVSMPWALRSSMAA